MPRSFTENMYWSVEFRRWSVLLTKKMLSSRMMHLIVGNVYFSVEL